MTKRASWFGPGMSLNRKEPGRARPGVHCLVVVASLFSVQTAGAAGTFYVDRANSSCSDSGPGTSTAPYCTISAALAARASSGTTINVRPGTYREQVTVSASGASGSPLVLRATGPGVIVDGADDFGSMAQWTLYSGNVWLASSVTWSPLQAFADGARLTPSTASPGSLPTRSFTYVSGSGLYANVGGGNPGSHQALVGHRTYGVRLSGKSWVTIDGFAVTRTEDRAVYLTSSSNNCVVTNNTVSFGNVYGIQATGCSSVLIGSNVVSDNNDHGIVLTTGSTGCTVQDNESFRNARPSVRAANGIYLSGANGNQLLRNRLHDNQDTGEQIQSSSNNNVSIQNRSWNNGDHGYDHLNSIGTLHVGDVAWGNYKDGFSIEGSAKGTRVFDCIATDNGLTTGEFDLWVDAGSDSGFVSDYNIFWNSTSQPPIKFISTQYSSIDAYKSASGQDANSTQANPRFVNPSGGDFHLSAGSPAIDAASSSVPNWPPTDAEGKSRFDDPGTPNTGTGSPNYADRGALEFISAANQPPVAALTVNPSSGNAPLNVTADASGSHDPDGSIVSYRFDFGDGTVVGPQASSQAGHTYAAGSWTCTVTVTDNGGLTGSASKGVTATGVDHPPVVTAPATASGPENTVITVNVTASDPDGNPITSLTADLTGLPAGNNAVFTPNASKTAGTLTWTPKFGDMRATPYNVTFTASNAMSGSASTAITVTKGDHPPVVVAPSTVSGAETSVITVDVTASDPDGEPITSLTADLGGLPPGNNAVFNSNASHTAGTLTWTPTFNDSRNAPYNVTFTATNAISGRATTAITVTNVDRAPSAAAPATASGAENSTITVNVTASDPDGDAITSLTADLSGLPPGNNAVFTTNATRTAGTLTWKPTFDDSRSTPYTVRFTAANAMTSVPAQTDITVSNTDRAPVVTAQTSVTANPGVQLVINVTAADPDGDAIASLTASLSGLPAGNATFVANATNTSGQLTWTPNAGDKGRYNVSFVATNALSGSATTNIRVAPHLTSGPLPTIAPMDPEPSQAGSLPTQLALSMAYPNPSRGAVAFALDLPRPARVKWMVQDLQGRVLWTEARTDPAGRALLSWNGTVQGRGRAPAGLYMVTVSVEGQRLARRLVVY